VQMAGPPMPELMQGQNLQASISACMHACMHTRHMYTLRKHSRHTGRDHVIQSDAASYLGGI
jgi:hypothetical protein